MQRRVLFTRWGDHQAETFNQISGKYLCSTGKAGTELSCRLGAARNEFDLLRRVWSHASISKSRKLQIYDACVVSKLMYCLDTVSLNVAEFNKLEAFHHRCLRKIAGIQPSYYSRVSNSDVRAALGSEPLIPTLRRRQLLYLGSIASKPTGHVLRDTVLDPNTLNSGTAAGPKRRGRPRQSWSKQVLKIATGIAGSIEVLGSLWNGTRASNAAWQRAVSQKCSQFH